MFKALLGQFNSGKTTYLRYQAAKSHFNGDYVIYLDLFPKRGSREHYEALSVLGAMTNNPEKSYADLLHDLKGGDYREIAKQYFKFNGDASRESFVSIYSTDGSKISWGDIETLIRCPRYTVDGAKQSIPENGKLPKLFVDNLDLLYNEGSDVRIKGSNFASFKELLPEYDIVATCNSLIQKEPPFLDVICDSVEWVPGYVS